MEKSVTICHLSPWDTKAHNEQKGMVVPVAEEPA
jgi:hypothetical protein